MAEEPLCMCDEHQGHDARFVSEEVDHTIPHRGNQALFWDRSNLHGMAKTCHSKKTRSGR